MSRSQGGLSARSDTASYTLTTNQTQIVIKPMFKNAYVGSKHLLSVKAITMVALTFCGIFSTLG
jgi:hypothetical protein